MRGLGGALRCAGPRRVARRAERRRRSATACASEVAALRVLSSPRELRAASRNRPLTLAPLSSAAVVAPLHVASPWCSRPASSASTTTPTSCGTATLRRRGWRRSRTPSTCCGRRVPVEPRTSVGVLSMAGAGVTLHVALTGNRQILSLSHGIAIGGEINITAGIQVAQLALKHRQNKNQRRRIIVFVGSPIADGELVPASSRRTPVAMDIVNFGEVRAARVRLGLPSSRSRPEHRIAAIPRRAARPHPPSQGGERVELEALLNAVNSDDNSHLVTVPPGPVLSDILLTSPIVQRTTAAAAAAAARRRAAAAAAAASSICGVDPTLDPEFAWALRASMEEERARRSAKRIRAEELRRWRGLRDGRVGAGGGGRRADGRGGGGHEGDRSHPCSNRRSRCRCPRRRRPRHPRGAAARDAGRPRRRPRAGAREKRAPPAAPATLTACSPTSRWATRPTITRTPRCSSRSPWSPEPSTLRRPRRGGARRRAPRRRAAPTTSPPSSRTRRSCVLSSLPGVDPNDPAIQSALSENLEKKDEGGERRTTRSEQWRHTFRPGRVDRRETRPRRRCDVKLTVRRMSAWIERNIDRALELGAGSGWGGRRAAGGKASARMRRRCRGEFSLPKILPRNTDADHDDADLVGNVERIIVRRQPPRALLRAVGPVSVFTFHGF